jgi:methylmalonyl-CoA mutase N-terminal domain/subunit
MDEALALPSEKAVKVALRTQQILAHESGVTNTIDPLAGSYFVEYMTNYMEEETFRYFDKINALGGVLKAIEKGFFQQEIANSAYRYQKDIDKQDRVIVGVNEFVEENDIGIPLLEMDPEGERKQLERLKRLRESRDQPKFERALSSLRKAAEGNENLMPYILDAVKANATLGETCNVLREVFKEYDEPPIY